MKSSLIIAFVILLACAGNTQAQNLSDSAIKTAITNALRSRPPWEMIAGGAIGIPANVRAQSVTIVRRGPYNNQKAYWPIQAQVSGTFDKKYHDGTSKRCTFAGTTDFQIYKNDYGDWLARATYAAETQLRPDCSGSATPIQPRGESPGDKQWQAFWTSFVKAVQTRNRVALRTMMSQDFECFFSSNTRNEAFPLLDRNNGRGWIELQRIVDQGSATIIPPKQWDIKGPSRTSPPRASDTRYAGYRALFVLKAGRWRWTSFHSGD